MKGGQSQKKVEKNLNFFEKKLKKVDKNLKKKSYKNVEKKLKKKS